MRSAEAEVVDKVVIRFAGDSGDGMQVIGDQFTSTTAVAGNDLATLPDFPAEIRAPAGTREGVSGFQIQFASHDIYTPGDQADVLVAMNPAALVANVQSLRAGGIVVVNTDKFDERDLAKARLTANPLTDGTLRDFVVVEAPITELTRRTVEPWGLGAKESDRCKNFFALGMMYWLFTRDMAGTETWIRGKFKAPYVEANLAALRAGWAFAETVELFQAQRRVTRATDLPRGQYRNITGNEALSIGLVAAAQRADCTLFYGSYPITPASDILHALANYKNFGVVTFQAEDEIAAVCASIGAAYGGSIGVTGTSGPGLALKAEALGLAMMAELPLIVINVQRGGPSTGLPTKTEQADLFQAMYGRSGEAPIPVLASRSPADCFEVAFEAVRIALKYMVPVIVLSDGYVANGSEPWRLPGVATLPDLRPVFRTDPVGFQPYARDPQTLARPWAIPGTPGLEHRIGGIEKQDGTGNISYDPLNHQKMCELRAEKVVRIRQDIAPTEVYGDDHGILVVGWGSTWGAIRAGVDEVRAAGHAVAQLHLRWLNPLPADLGAILERYDRVLVPEMNLGQLVKILRAEYLVDARPFSKVQGQPFRAPEIRSAILAQLEVA